MGFRYRYKRRELACPREQGSWDPSSHTQNGCKQDREWKCAARQSSRQGNRARVVKDMKVRARFKYRECFFLFFFFFYWGGCEGIPNEFHANECPSWLCCSVWQQFGSSSNRTDTLQWSQVQWSPGKQRKMCWAQNLEVVTPLRASQHWKKKNISMASRCSFQQRFVCEYEVSVLCAHSCFVLGVHWLFDSHALP